MVAFVDTWLLSIVYLLRPWIPVTVLGFQVILGKCTGKVNNRKSNISVHFWHLPKDQKSACYWKSYRKWPKSYKFRYNFSDFRVIFDWFGHFIYQKMTKMGPLLFKGRYRKIISGMTVTQPNNQLIWLSKKSNYFITYLQVTNINSIDPITSSLNSII